MPELKSISAIVRKVVPGHVPSHQERLVHLRAGQVVDAPRGLWGKLMTPDEVWSVDHTPQRGEGVGGLLQGVELTFVGGEAAQIDVRYTRLRPVASREAVLVLALAGRDDLEAVVEGRLLELVSECVTATELSPAAWHRAQFQLQEEIRRRVSQALGLEAHIELLSPKRAGPAHHDVRSRPIALRGCEESVPLRLELTTDDDLQRLPVHAPVDELTRAQEVVERVCSKLSLDELHRDLASIRSTLTHAIGQALVPLARRVQRLSVSLATTLPPEQLSVAAELVVDFGQPAITLALKLVLKRTSVELATNFLRRHETTVDAAVAARARELAEELFAGATLATVFVDGQPLFDRLLHELDSWLQRAAGYRVSQGQVEPKTPRPQPMRRVILDVSLDVAPISGRTLDIEVRATAELADEPTWLRRGAPRGANAWKDDLRDHVRAALHTRDEAEAIRSKADLERVLRKLLAELVERDGYVVSNLRLRMGAGIPPRERSCRVAATGEFVFGGSGSERVRLEFAGGLTVTDEWSYAMWQDERAPGWADVLVLRIAEDELKLQTREDLRLASKTIEENIRARFVAQAALRGYTVERLRILGLELAHAPTYVRETLQLIVPLLRPDDEASWCGTVEVTLGDEALWVKAGEPDPRALLQEWATRSLLSACQQSRPGDVDEVPESVAHVFEADLGDELGRRGFTLKSLRGQLKATHSPAPAEEIDELFTCRVGRRSVDVRATARVRLQSAALWRESTERDLKRWLRGNTRDVIQHVLLPMRFADVLHDIVRVHRGQPAEVSERVTADLQSRAARLGYAVDQVLAFPDQEARDLLTGFEFEVKETFSTAWSEREVVLHAQVTGRFDDFSGEEVGGLLSRGESVVEWLRARVTQALRVEVRDLTPNDIFFRWYKEQGDMRRTLASAIEERLRGFAVVEPNVQLTPHPPPYIEGLRMLRGSGPYSFTVDLEPREHRSAFHYDGTFIVEGLDERGADNLFSRADPPTAGQIGDEIGEKIATLISDRTNEQVLREDSPGGDFSRIFQAAGRAARELCGDIFGLAVKVVSMRRDAQGIERARWRLVDMRVRSLEALASGEELIAEQYLERIKQGDHAGAEALRARLERSLAPGGGRDALRADPGAAPWDALPRTATEIEIPSSGDGYASAEPDCLLPLTVWLRGLLPEKSTELVAQAQRLVGAALGNIEPARFWLGFDRRDGDHPEPAKVVEQALLDGLDRPDAPWQIKEIVVEPPPERWRVVIRGLTSVDVEVDALDVAIAGGLVPGKLFACFTVERPARGCWRRLERTAPDTERLRAWACVWFADRLARVRVGDEQRLHEQIGGAFVGACIREYGLEVELQRIKLDLTDRERLAGDCEELRNLEARMARLDRRADASDRLLLEQLRVRREALLAAAGARAPRKGDEHV